MAITNDGNFGNEMGVPLVDPEQEQQPERWIVLQPKTVSIVCSVFRFISANSSSAGYTWQHLRAKPKADFSVPLYAPCTCLFDLVGGNELSVEVGEFSPEVGEFDPQVVEIRPQVGEIELQVGEKQAQVVE